MGDTLSTLRLWEKDPKYSGVKAKIKNLDDETRKLVDEFLREQDNVHEQKNKLEKQYSQLVKIYDSQTQDNGKLLKEIESLKAELKQADYKKGQHSISMNRDETTKIIEGCLEEQTKQTTEIKHLQQEIRKLENEREKSKVVLEKLKRDNTILSSEKESALSRLSKIAGIQLTTGNSAIADLGDVNRPTNLAEKYNNLYTEEWMEAYSEITMKKTMNMENNKTEKELCNILTAILETIKCQLNGMAFDDTSRDLRMLYRINSAIEKIDKIMLYA